LCRLPTASDFSPDFVIEFGQPATSGAWSKLLQAHPSITRVVVCEHAWADPHNSAALVVRANPGEVARGLYGRLPPAGSGWVERLSAANQAGRRCVEGWLDDHVSLTPPPEGCLVRVAVEELQPGDLLVVGNSLPIRVLDSVCGRLPADVRVVSQRGANGIDGLISLAIGAARAQAQGRTTLLLGDVSALHDVGALLTLAKLRPELNVVVVDNAGGRIFEHLPIGSHPQLEAWTTPHDVEIHALAQAFGLCGVRVEDAEELRAALQLGRRAGGPLWIHARASADGALRMYEELGEALSLALSTHG
jgi:2-succinyl-5-enolpyruvyl-6-hydroxy-3-cyclohexene-1-carboxylate synthase